MSKSNKSLIVLTSCVAVATITAISFSNSSNVQLLNEKDVNSVSIGAQVADDFNSNIRSLGARLKQSEKNNKALRTQIQKNGSKLDDLSKNNNKPGNGPSNKIISSFQRQITALKAEIRSQHKEATGKYPVGNSKGRAKQLASSENSFVDIDALASDSEVEAIKGGFSQKSRMTNLHHKILAGKNSISQKNTKEIKTPYYTIPAGSDLQNATLLTALIGEVPLKGKLIQPLFPFSTIISRGDLMSANGMELPRDIIGMKVGGFAYGVGSFLDNISCVRAYATSMLFVFRDGTFKAIVDDNQQSSATLVSSNSLGYLSDQFGNPCIKGKYQTNAPQVLSALLGAGIVKGAGSAISQWQQSTTYGNGSSTQVPTGSFGKFMGGKAMAEGSGLAAEWLKDRLGESFDVVYVPSSIPVNYKGQVKYIPNRLMLHITKNIEIDKSSTSRRINYGKRNQARDYRF